MKTDIRKHMKATRFKSLPEAMRLTLKATRLAHGWSQHALGVRVGLPQMHISGIESGKIVPRFDTLLELVRVLGYDLLMVPRALVPTVQSLTRNQDKEGDEQPLYATDETSWEQGNPHDEI